MKYIIIGTEGLEMAILFNECLTHSEIAGERKIVSAGFCYISQAQNKNGEPEIMVVTIGTSISLNKCSQPGDSEIIKRSITFST